MARPSIFDRPMTVAERMRRYRERKRKRKDPPKISAYEAAIYLQPIRWFAPQVLRCSARPSGSTVEARGSVILRSGFTDRPILRLNPREAMARTFEATEIESLGWTLSNPRWRTVCCAPG